MSGVEVLSLVSSVAAILDAAAKVVNAARDASGLPPNFRVVARRLPLIMDTLRIIQDGLDYDADQNSYTAMKLVLEECKKKAVALEKTFEVVMPAAEASAPRRMAAAMRTFGKGKRVETLMKGIVEDLQLLTGNHALKAPARQKIPDSLAKTMNTSPTGLADRQRPMSSISNYGPGQQSIHLGEGDQNINTGGGPQFNGTFSGPFNFSAPATPLYGSEKEHGGFG
ncbi:hypothetical protein QBC35DRAFT_254894 [Podospora australis]|uniref:NACHT-NTPase and P-loop NTPases N-terminal domain-containing protein n=1 Tax=Podospora australis TaxID=1536484 RepID=A0AAN6WRU1_9PEZI|nr:hypothetical protein QBC35DRAFT_254894 [Podospora australis]